MTGLFLIPASDSPLLILIKKSSGTMGGGGGVKPGESSIL
jgi:hypothetical protein